MENFEDKLRDKLADHQLPVDMESIWQGVQASKQKKKKRFLFWWIFPALLITGLGIYLGISKYDSFTHPNENLDSVSAIDQSEQIQNQDPTSSTINEPNVDVVNKDALQNKDINSNKDNEINSDKNKSNKPGSEIKRKGNKLAKGKPITSSDSTVPFNPSGSTIQASSIAVKSDENAVEPTEKVAVSENPYIKTDILEKLPILQSFISSIILLPDFLFVNTDKKYTKKQASSSIYSLVGMNAALAQTNPLDLLNCAKPQYGFNLEIGYQKQIRKSPFSYQIGLGFNHILFHSRKTNYETKTVESYDSTITLRQLNGEESIIGDVIYGNQTTTTIRNNYQRSHIFNGIMGLAYTKSAGKLGYGVNAGIGFNILTSSKGYYYCQNENEQLDFASFMKSNIGFSARLGLILDYDLSRNLTLLTQLNANYYFKPLSISENAYRNFSLAGIQVGMQYKW